MDTRDEPENLDTSEEESDESSPSLLASRSLNILARSIILSLFIHLSPLLLTLHLSPELDTFDLNTEWFGEFEDLQAVGHGNLERQVQFIPPPEKPEEPKKEEEPPKEEPEPPKPKPEEPEKEEPKKVEEKKPEPKQKKEEPKLAALDKKKPKPKKVEPKKDTEPKKTEPAPKDEAEPKKEDTTPPEPTPQKVARSAESLPGLEYAGPSNLPMLQNYAPGNARMTALIRLDVVRDTPYHEPTKKLLSVVPDYRIILDGSTTDPVRDFDTIFTASANPIYIQETFLVVKHSLGQKRLKAHLDGRFASPPPWGTYSGVKMRPIVPESSAYQDSRKILISDDSTALVARTEWLKTLTRNQDADAAIRPGFDGDEPPKFTMLQSFEHIANAAPGDTMLLATFQGLNFMLPGIGTLPRTETLRVSITTPEKPHLTIDLQFKSAERAAKFASDCPSMKRKLISKIPGARFMKIDTYITRLSCTASENYVTVEGTYTQKEFLRAINLTTPFLPKPTALEDLPRPPEREEPEHPADTPPAAADAGPDLSSADMSAPDMAPDATPDMPSTPKNEGDPPAIKAPDTPPPAPTADMGTSASTEEMDTPPPAPRENENTPPEPQPTGQPDDPDEKNKKLDIED